jgi:hypothetical protein
MTANVVSLAPSTRAHAWLRVLNVMAERLASQLAVRGVLVVRKSVGRVSQQTDGVVAVKVCTLLKLIMNTNWYRGCWRQRAR